MRTKIITLDGMEELYKRCLDEGRAPTDHELRLALDYVVSLKKRFNNFTFRSDEYDLMENMKKRIQIAEWYYSRLEYLKDKFPEVDGYEERE